MVAQANSKIEAYFEAWVSSLASLLSQLSGNDWQPQPASAVEEYVRHRAGRLTAAKGLTGQQWLSFSAADAAVLLRSFLQEEINIAAELDARCSKTPWRSWSGSGQVWRPARWKRHSARCRWRWHLSLRRRTPSPAARLLHVSDGSGTWPSCWNWTMPWSRRWSAGPAPSRTAGNPSAEIESLLRQGNLGLLMDVELGVMLRFGCRQATLREVLELTSGAVLELDREIQEPVDLLLNGRVIARGDVVVIDGNYGLRVTEVASPQQRVDSL